MLNSWSTLNPTLGILVKEKQREIYDTEKKTM